MQYKQIRVRKEIHEELVKLAGELQLMYGKKVSMSDTIEFLFKHYRKKVEISV